MSFLWSSPFYFTVEISYTSLQNIHSLHQGYYFVAYLIAERNIVKVTFAFPCIGYRNLSRDSERSRELIYLPVYEDYSPTTGEDNPNKIDPIRLLI